MKKAKFINKRRFKGIKNIKGNSVQKNIDRSLEAILHTHNVKY